MKKKYPLTVLKEFQKVNNKIKELVKEFSEYIYIQKTEEFMINVRDKDPNSSFFFNILGFESKENKILFKTEHAPFSQGSVAKRAISYDSDKTILIFTNWIKRLIEYETIILSEDEQLEQDYIKEQESWFMTQEDDSNDKPLEIETQLALDVYIQKSIGFAESENQTIIVKELEDFRNDIGSLTKSEIVSSPKSRPFES